MAFRFIRSTATGHRRIRRSPASAASRLVGSESGWPKRESIEYIPMEQLNREQPERWREFVAGGYASQTDFESFVVTVTAGLQNLIDANTGKRIAVFCHGGVINSWATHILGIAPRLFLDAGYASVSRFLAASTGQHSISSLNEIAHLRDLRHPAP